MKNKFTVLVLGAVLLITLALAARPGILFPKPPQSVKIIYCCRGNTFFFPYLGQKAGIFQKHGIDAELVKMGTPAGTSAVISGSADVHTSIEYLAKAAAKGERLKAVYITVDKRTMALTVDPAVIKDVKDLNGKRIGITSKTISFFAPLEKFLKDNGVTVEYVSVKAHSARVAMVKSGALAAHVVGYPEALKEEKNGFGVIVYAKDFPMLSMGVVMRSDDVEKNPDLVRRVVGAVHEAQEFIRTNEAAVKPLMREWVLMTEEHGLSDAEYDAIWPALYEDLLSSMTKNGIPSDAAVAYTSEQLRSAGLSDDLSGFLDYRFIDKSK